MPTAQALIEKMQARGASIPIAVDVVCGKKFDENEPAVLKDSADVEDDDMIFDIGPRSAMELAGIISKVRTIAAYAYRHSKGQPYIYPDPSLSYNFV